MSTLIPQVPIASLAALNEFLQNARPLLKKFRGLGQNNKLDFGKSEPIFEKRLPPPVLYEKPQLHALPQVYEVKPAYDVKQVYDNIQHSYAYKRAAQNKGRKVAEKRGIKPENNKKEFKIIA